VNLNWSAVPLRWLRCVRQLGEQHPRNSAHTTCDVESSRRVRFLEIMPTPQALEDAIRKRLEEKSTAVHCPHILTAKIWSGRARRPFFVFNPGPRRRAQWSNRSPHLLDQFVTAPSACVIVSLPLVIAAWKRITLLGTPRGSRLHTPDRQSLSARSVN